VINAERCLKRRLTQQPQSALPRSGSSSSWPRHSRQAHPDACTARSRSRAPTHADATRGALWGSVKAQCLLAHSDRQRHRPFNAANTPYAGSSAKNGAKTNTSPRSNRSPSTTTKQLAATTPPKRICRIPNPNAGCPCTPLPTIFRAEQPAGHPTGLLARCNPTRTKLRWTTARDTAPHQRFRKRLDQGHKRKSGHPQANAAMPRHIPVAVNDSNNNSVSSFGPISATIEHQRGQPVKHPCPIGRQRCQFEQQ